jgi:hypothetical protein
MEVYLLLISVFARLCQYLGPARHGSVRVAAGSFRAISQRCVPLCRGPGRLGVPLNPVSHSRTSSCATASQTSSTEGNRWQGDRSHEADS